MAFPLQKLLRAMLFSTHQPLSVKEIQAAFARFHEQPLIAASEPRAALGVEPAGTPVAGGVEGPVETTAEPEIPDQDADLYRDVPSLVPTAQIREAMDALKVQIESADLGLALVEGSSGYRLVCDPRYARWLRLLRQEPPPARLAAPALETLAVVAYRQPVTRHEIETIRGVSAEAGLNRLIERELIAVVGRAEQPGRPLQYGTTDKFLEFVGIKSVDELPASDVLTSRQIDEWLTRATDTRFPGDAEMGLDESAPSAASPDAPAQTAGLPGGPEPTGPEPAPEAETSP